MINSSVIHLPLFYLQEMHLHAIMIYKWDFLCGGSFKLLVVEGFLKHENRCKSFEEKAKKCLEDLVRRSLVLVTRKFTREIKSCNLHDVVRDLCIRKTKEEKFFLHVMDNKATCGVAMKLKDPIVDIDAEDADNELAEA
ncbi:hypothetical protein ACS0TY_034284 [Phlomoides rotata]